MVADATTAAVLGKVIIAARRTASSDGVQQSSFVASSSSSAAEAVADGDWAMVVAVVKPPARTVRLDADGSNTSDLKRTTGGAQFQVCIGSCEC